MDLDKLHAVGEEVVVFWPGGPYHFTILFSRAEAAPHPDPRWESWFMITGLVVEPVGNQHRATRSFFVHPVEGGYALLPMRN